MTGITEQARDFSPRRQKIPTVRVLVVDDEPLIRWSVSETLMDKGCSVIEAADGRGTMQALEEATAPIDVVLLDYRLPDSNDLTLLSAVRRVSPTSQVILMSAYGTPEVVAGALDLGAYRVVKKPIEMTELAHLVMQAHGSRSF
jgi:two-component system, NtrC family, response regulator AtoC